MKVKEFLVDFTGIGDSDDDITEQTVPVAKYKAQLELIANREQVALFVDLDDVQIFDQGLEFAVCLLN